MHPSQKGSLKGSRDCSREGSKRVLRRCLAVGFNGRRVLRRGFREGTSKAEVRLFESTTPLACALLMYSYTNKRGVFKLPTGACLHTVERFCSRALCHCKQRKEGAIPSKKAIAKRIVSKMLPL